MKKFILLIFSLLVIFGSLNAQPMGLALPQKVAPIASITAKTATNPVGGTACASAVIQITCYRPDGTALDPIKKTGTDACKEHYDLGYICTGYDDEIYCNMCTKTYGSPISQFVKTQCPGDSKEHTGYCNCPYCKGGTFPTDCSNLDWNSPYCTSHFGCRSEIQVHADGTPWYQCGFVPDIHQPLPCAGLTEDECNYVDKKTSGTCHWGP